MASKSSRTKPLNILMLVMINLAALGSIKSWPTISELGTSCIFYLLLAAVFFFIPLALISAELATTYPERGGVFVWVKQAFGHRLGFLAVWLLWAQNLIWYPTVLSFIAGTLTYLINPALATNKTYNILIILACLWGTTFFNLLGMKASGWFSALCTLLGIFIPSMLIITLGLLWIFSGNPLEIAFTWTTFIPQFNDTQHLAFFAGVIFACTGIEMSAVHAKDVKDPTRNYPKAIAYSACIFFTITLLGVLSIVCIVPNQELSLTSGSMQAFSSLLSTHHLQKLTPFFAFLIALGALGSLSTWLAGPSKGLLAAAQKGDLPSFFKKVNAHSSPRNLLLTQAGFVSLLCLLFVWMPTVNSVYWILTALSIQLYLIMYLLLFAAALRLRYTQRHQSRPYRVPGGQWGIWILSLFGFCSALFAYVISFFPPDNLNISHTTFYLSFLVAGVLFFCLCPQAILWWRQKR